MMTVPTPARFHLIDLKTMIGLIFTDHLLIPTDLCPTFPLYKPTSIFSALKIARATWVLSFSCAGIPDLNSFLVSSPSISLPLDSCQWQVAIWEPIWEPGDRCSYTFRPQLQFWASQPGAVFLICLTSPWDFPGWSSCPK